MSVRVLVCAELDDDDDLISQNNSAIALESELATIWKPLRDHHLPEFVFRNRLEALLVHINLQQNSAVLCVDERNDFTVIACVK